MQVQRLSKRKLLKQKKVEELVKMIKGSPCILAFSLNGVRANVIHELRRKLRGTTTIKVAKKGIFARAAKIAGMDKLAERVEREKEPLGFIFSTLGAYKLALDLERSKIPMHAKANEKADFDVTVPEQNTGLPPGPILSEFGKLKIPTRIEGGSIWIARDTLVAKKGDEISPALASLLARLDIKSVLKGLDPIFAYEDGIIIESGELKLDIDSYVDQIVSAYTDAIKLSLETSYPTKDTIEAIIARAWVGASYLASEAGFVTKENAEQAIRHAYLKALALYSMVGSKIAS